MPINPDAEAAVDQLLADIPGLGDDPAGLEQAAANILAGKDPEVPDPALQREVAAALRRRAVRLRTRGFSETGHLPELLARYRRRYGSQAMPSPSPSHSGR